MRHAAIGIGLGASPLVTFGAMHMFGSSATPQAPTVTDDFMSVRFWLTIVVMLLGGAFGGVSYELLLRKGAIELPHRVHTHAAGRNYSHAPAETLIALGIVGRALVGSAAALCVLMVASPATGHAALALSVTAGAAAPALIRLMKRQLLVLCNVLDRFNQGQQRQAATPKPARPKLTAVPKPAMAPKAAAAAQPA